jgi:hypothetical protein
VFGLEALTNNELGVSREKMRGKQILWSLTWCQIMFYKLNDLLLIQSSTPFNALRLLYLHSVFCVPIAKWLCSSRKKFNKRYMLRCNKIDNYCVWAFQGGVFSLLATHYRSVFTVSHTFNLAAPMLIPLACQTRICGHPSFLHLHQK